MKRLIVVLYALATGTLSLSASEIKDKDTVSVATQNSGVFLNAASDSKPREVSLGLPTNKMSAVQIFEDGMQTSYYIYGLFPYKSWHGGASSASNGTMEPMEAAMRFCEVGTYVDSKNKLGQDTFGGTVSYTLGSFGQNKFDINISGPIANGWQYSISTFQNFDPGSNFSVSHPLQDRHQFYKGVITKRFNDNSGHMSLVYQYVDYRSVFDKYGPFIFVGDGSVKPYNGFSLGTDSYLPDFNYFPYMDFRTGEMKEQKYEERDNSHHLTFLLDKNLSDGIHFDFGSRFKTGRSDRGSGILAGIETAGPEAGFAYVDGTPYSGAIQKRNMMVFDSFETSWMNNAEIQFSRGNHKLRIGADYQFNHAGQAVSTALLAQEICVNPDVLYKNGEMTSSFNNSGEFYDGYEHKAAVYAKDEWKFNDRMTFSGFVRAEFNHIHGDAANNIGDDTSNTRYPGFNLTKGKITQFKQNFLNGSFGLDFNLNIVGGLSFKAEAVATRIHPNINTYGGYYYPSTDPTDTRFARAGFTYNNRWINIVSQLIYISKTNFNTRSNFQHKLQKTVGDLPAGYLETKSIAQIYGIESIGWTTDAIIRPFAGFDLHVNFLIRDPQYKDFFFNPTFSDGVTEEYDFSGNNVTGLHKMELTLDPSYSFDDWRFWFTARYISKQYINKTNSLYFNGRWETFGGIDYSLTKTCRLSLNVINVLNQKGASGEISSADLVTDTSAYKDYLIAGSFIRPFTVEFGVNIKF